MEEKDGWKRVRATVPDYRIINRAERKARKSHKHGKIYVRGAHYEYLFEKVAGMRSIIYRKRLIHYKDIDRKRRLIKVGITLVILVIGIYLYFGTVDNKNAVNNTLENYVENSSIKDNTSIIEIWEESIVNDIIENIITKTENISLQTTVTEEDLRDCENYIFIITNEKRAIHGVPKLVWDSNLADMARKHSLDMAQNNYFSHTNLGNEDPTMRAIRHGYNTHKDLGGGWYSEGIAENIGMMPTGNVIGIGYVYNDPESIAIAHIQSWMESSGHRTNILDVEYIRMGVGVAYDKESNSYIATQNFW